MNYSIKIGNTQHEFVTGSLSQWTHVLLILGACACMFAAFGSVVGIVFRRYPRAQMALTVFATTALFAYWQFQGGTLSISASLAQNLASAFELSGVFFPFFLVPAALASLFVGRWAARRSIHLTNRSS